MKKPIIGIVGRPIKSSENVEVYATYEKIRKAIIKAGGIPLAILPVDDKTYQLDGYLKEELSKEAKEDLVRLLDFCDGIVLQGGSKWYSYDEFIVSYLMKKDVPTLGICLGMQLLAYMDSSLKPVLNHTKINHEQRGVEMVHSLTILEDTLLFKIIGKKEIMVNSHHKCHIEKLNQFKVSAISSDGLIEAIWNPLKKFMLGVQFHPESMLESQPEILKIFEFFIKSCS